MSVSTRRTRCCAAQMAARVAGQRIARGRGERMLRVRYPTALPGFATRRAPLCTTTRSAARLASHQAFPADLLVVEKAREIAPHHRRGAGIEPLHSGVCV